MNFFSTFSIKNKFLVGLLVWLGLGLLNSSFSTHNLAGQITYNKTGPNTYEIIITTYTDPSEVGVDRCSLALGIYQYSNFTLLDEIEEVGRVNGPLIDPNVGICQPLSNGNVPTGGEYIVGMIKKNIYKTTYTFSGPGNFIFGISDDNRLSNIINMNNSHNTAFHVNTWVRNNPIIGQNGSPHFLNDPIDFACVGELWTHNPGAYDPEGDSLSYFLIPSKKNIGQEVNGYLFPDEIGGDFSIDPITGLISWETPHVEGIYNVAFIVEEWRNGIKIGESIRDMAVFVEDDCQNDPPIIEAITDTCIQAGEKLIINYLSYDQNEGDSIYFMSNNAGQGLNGPFSASVSPQAVFTSGIPQSALSDTLYGAIEWETGCQHIRKQFYQVDLYAHDNLSYAQNPDNGFQMLSDNHIIKIQIVAPAVTGLALTEGPREVFLKWDYYSCPNALGYNIYRKFGEGQLPPNDMCCETKAADAGFELIASTTSLSEVNYTDDLSTVILPEGGKICYVVEAYFQDFETSCPSNLECIELGETTFFITNDSIGTTDPGNGTVFISWSSPDTSQLNLNFISPPFHFDIFVSDGGPFSKLNSSPLALNDTTFLHQGTNTKDFQWSYYITLNDSEGSLYSTPAASSIYLSAQAGDQIITLSGLVNTPWTNVQYSLFRSENGPSGPWTFVDVLSSPEYTDTSLINGVEYCYYVQSDGDYPGQIDVKFPLINDSQIICAKPSDLTPPCLSENDLDTSFSCQELTFELFFSNEMPDCRLDLSHYLLFYSADSSKEYSLHSQIDTNQSSFSISPLRSIAGCYHLVAVDTSGNQSAPISYCLDNCPEFEPGNIFSPNNDGINDMMNPFLNRSVDIISVEIFDRWGYRVSHKQGPMENNDLWDGKNTAGKEVPSGIYYYKIEYEEIRLGGNILMEPLVNFVTLIR